MCQNGIKDVSLMLEGGLGNGGSRKERKLMQAIRCNEDLRKTVIRFQHMNSVLKARTETTLTFTKEQT